jgi:putative spermidine/putrescine transport system substrate-binding protein
MEVIMHDLTKRTNCFITIAAAFFFLTCSAVFAEDSITVVSFGGAYTKSQIEAYHKPFTKKTGIKVNSADYSGGIAQIRAQVEAGNVTWDVVDVETQDIMAASDEGLLEVIDLSMVPPGIDGTPAKNDFIPNALHECGVGNIVWSNIIAYDKTRYHGKKPSTIQDFFDVKKFPGMRGMIKRPNGPIEYAIMADGVPPKDVYKVLSTKKGLDRTFAKLDSIKDSIIFFDTYAQGPQMLADGEAVMIMSANGRIFNAIAKEGKPFAIIWDHQIYNMDYYVVPKGSKNKENAIKFVLFATGSQPLADQTKYISYGPVRKSSVSLIKTYMDTDIDMAPHMPTAPENFKSALANSPEWWADNQDEMIKRYNAWMIK